MLKVLKWIGIIVGGLVGLVVVALGVMTLISVSRMNRTYEVEVASFDVPTDEASIAEGERLFTSRGCYDCHGANLGGTVMIDDFAFGRLVAPNITSGNGGVLGSYTDEDIVRSIRYGVGQDGKPLAIMPSDVYNRAFNDRDLANVIAYIRNAPPVDSDFPTNRFGPAARIIHVSDAFPLLPVEVIDLDAAPPEIIEPGVTVEYGEYLANNCRICHGENLGGQDLPISTLPIPNITPDDATGLGTWSEEDFFHALRTGQRPDGTLLDPEEMPWVAYGQMSDEELSALWLYLQSLEPVAFELE